MANSVNGVAAISTDAHRERVPIEYPQALRCVSPGNVLRARVSLDTTGDFTVDDPTVANPDSRTGQSIFVVGLQYANATANTLILKSKVGSGTAINIGQFELTTNGGILIPMGLMCQTVTEAGGKLQVSASGASGDDTVDIIIYYLIADKFIVKG